MPRQHRTASAQTCVAAHALTRLSACASTSGAEPASGAFVIGCVPLSVSLVLTLSSSTPSFCFPNSAAAPLSARSGASA
jgi:hypothetical protein